MRFSKNQTISLIVVVLVLIVSLIICCCHNNNGLSTTINDDVQSMKTFDVIDPYTGTSAKGSVFFKSDSIIVIAEIAKKSDDLGGIRISCSEHYTPIGIISSFCDGQYIFVSKTQIGQNGGYVSFGEEESGIDLSQDFKGYIEIEFNYDNSANATDSSITIGAGSKIGPDGFVILYPTKQIILP